MRKGIVQGSELLVERRAWGLSWGLACTEGRSGGRSWPDDTDANASSRETFSARLEGAQGLCIWG